MVEKIKRIFPLIFEAPNFNIEINSSDSDFFVVNYTKYKFFELVGHGLSFAIHDYQFEFSKADNLHEIKIIFYLNWNEGNIKISDNFFKEIFDVLNYKIKTEKQCRRIAKSYKRSHWYCHKRGLLCAKRNDYTRYSFLWRVFNSLMSILDYLWRPKYYIGWDFKHFAQWIKIKYKLIRFRKNQKAYNEQLLRKHNIHAK
jgi:hypothetical protein